MAELTDRFDSFDRTSRRAHAGGAGRRLGERWRPPLGWRAEPEVVLDKAVRYRKAAPDPRRSSVSVHVIHAIMHAKLDPPGH